MSAITEEVLIEVFERLEALSRITVEELGGSLDATAGELADKAVEPSDIFGHLSEAAGIELDDALNFCSFAMNRAASYLTSAAEAGELGEFDEGEYDEVFSVRHAAMLLAFAVLVVGIKAGREAESA
jgi:hypothetical protein